MLNAMSLLSRFSRDEKNHVGRVINNTLPVLEDRIHAGTPMPATNPHD